MKAAAALVILAGLALSATATIYFQETFSDGDAFAKRWIASKVKDADGTAGVMKVTAGKFYADAEDDKGLQTSQDARFYLYSAAMPAEFSNKGKKLILQYQVKHEQNIDCGGGYLKLLASDAFADQTKFSPDSQYYLMFGPDVCGTSTKRTHVILGKGEKNHLIKKEVKCETDELSHLYTFILNPDNTYEVRLDNVKVESGNLEDDWDMVPPKQIPDPEAKKPADWVDEPEMDDPEDKKPADWDSIPARIPDAEAKKPEDWDTETDGEWEAPTIENPAYKGPWHAKRIPNPAYKGAWVHPMIANPDYKTDAELYVMPKIKYVGIDLWQVKSGSIFDNIIVTDSEEEAAEWAKKFEARKAPEKAMHEKIQEEERKAAEEKAKTEKPAEEPAPKEEL